MYTEGGWHGRRDKDGNNFHSCCIRSPPLPSPPKRVSSRSEYFSVYETISPLDHYFFRFFRRFHLRFFKYLTSAASECSLFSVLRAVIFFSSREKSSPREDESCIFRWKEFVRLVSISQGVRSLQSSFWDLSSLEKRLSNLSIYFFLLFRHELEIFQGILREKLSRTLSKIVRRSSN